MAATVSSSVWGMKSKAGAWALDAEQHEEELLRDLQSSTPKANPNEPPSSDFPTLAAAASTKTKKKKAQTLSLADFSTYAAPSKSNEILSLPTGPRERTAEELERSRSGFGGGGFRSYGYDSANPRGAARVSERDDGPSRADEADDWSKSKKFSGVDGDRRDKGGFFNSSRADEVDNWASTKKALPPSPYPSFSSSEGGRRDRDRRSGMGFDSFSSSSSSTGADSDKWTSGRVAKDNNAGAGFERERRGVGFESSGAAADSENWLKKKEAANGGVVDAAAGGGGGGGGRPRLNLQRRTVPITNNITSLGQEVKPKGSNPFGDARPREEVLKDKGQDWKEIDDKLDAQKVKEEAPAADFRRKGFGLGRNDSLLQMKTWRKDSDESEAAQPASAEQVENGDADKAEDAAADKAEDAAAEADNTQNGDAEKN